MIYEILDAQVEAMIRNVVSEVNSTTHRAYRNTKAYTDGRVLKGPVLLTSDGIVECDRFIGNSDKRLYATTTDWRLW